MIELLLGELLLQNVPDPQPFADEIVIIGEELKSVKFRAGFENDTGFCEVTQSSGDAEIDAVVCKSVNYCSDYTKAMFLRLQDLPRRQRKAAREQLNETVGQCMASAHERFVENLAEQRWMERQSQSGEAK